MTFRERFRGFMAWAGKAYRYTAIGAGIGAAEGALSGSIGTAMILSLSKAGKEPYSTDEGALVTAFGGAVVGGTVGFIASTPSSTYLINMECAMCCGSWGTALSMITAAVGSQSLSAVVGYAILTKLMDDLAEYSYSDLAVNQAVGGFFALAITGILVAMYICCGDVCVGDSDRRSQSYSPASRGMDNSAADVNSREVFDAENAPAPVLLSVPIPTQPVAANGDAVEVVVEGDREEEDRHERAFTM